MATPDRATHHAPDFRSGSPTARVETSSVVRSGMVVWTLRLIGLSALVNGGGFGAYAVPAAWHLAHDHVVWYANAKPTYGYGPFEDHGIHTTVALDLAFFGACLVLAVGGVLLLVPRSAGIVVTLAGMALCAPFWWGFDLPLAWVNAGIILALFALAAGVRLTLLRFPSPRRSTSA